MQQTNPMGAVWLLALLALGGMAVFGAKGKWKLINLGIIAGFVGFGIFAGWVAGMWSRIRPMRLRLMEEPFDHPDYLFELKRDGFVRRISNDKRACVPKWSNSPISWNNIKADRSVSLLPWITTQSRPSASLVHALMC
jgi:hypothetical protein